MTVPAADLAAAFEEDPALIRWFKTPSGSKVFTKIENLVAEEVANHLGGGTEVEDVPGSRPDQNNNR